MWCGSIATPPFWTTIGPVSTPASGRNTVTPVSVSPSRICQASALPPRYFGSNEGWKQSEPWRGASTISAGRMIVTKASTLRSAPSAACSATRSGIAAPFLRSVFGRSRRSPRFSASSASGSGRAPGRRRVHADDLVARVEQPHQHVAPERAPVRSTAMPLTQRAPVRSPTVPRGSAGVP